MMNYCMDCGTKLINKYLDKEGMVPYCETCGKYCFPIFNAAVSMIIYDTTKDRILLIKQYGNPAYILVAGYINRGENAEDAVRREIMEEVGLHVDKITFNKSSFFEPSNTLMLNFVCYASHTENLTANDEVDSWEWFSLDKVRENIKPNSLAKEFLCAYLDKEFKKTSSSIK